MAKPTLTIIKLFIVSILCSLNLYIFHFRLQYTVCKLYYSFKNEDSVNFKKKKSGPKDFGEGTVALVRRIWLTQKQKLASRENGVWWGLMKGKQRGGNENCEKMGLSGENALTVIFFYLKLQESISIRLQWHQAWEFMKGIAVIKSLRFLAKQTQKALRSWSSIREKRPWLML